MRLFASIELDVHSPKLRASLSSSRRSPNGFLPRQPFAFAHNMTRPAAPLLLALFEPDIAQNTGAMMRTCACLGVDAAIIEPAGFRINDSRFRRAAMDYIDALSIESHNSWASFAAWRAANQRRLVLLTTKGDTCLWDFAFREKDIILVGRESSGVPEAVRVSADVRVYIPIQPPLRSLNVGIAATIAMTEGLRQLGRLPSSRKGEG
jgi:tRNA (cytidine/uridine-2'-O-)-methyltransferase